MENIFVLTIDVILCIFRFLHIEDRISFALTCQRFRRLCVNEGVFRKLDLSRSAMSTSQQVAVYRFFRDRRLTQHIRELNVSNFRVLNWEMDDHLQEFIVSICPQLEALHVVNSGLSLQTLHSILQEAPHLTSLSWSIWDSTYEDLEFLSMKMKSSGGVCFKNIKHLRLHVNESLPQIQIAQYLVLSCCRDVKEVEIYTWGIDEEYCSGGSFPLASDQSIPGFHLPSVKNKLNNLNSLVVEGELCCKVYSEQMYEFVDSVVSRKSSSTTWKKFWISPTKYSINREQLSCLFEKVHSDDFHSVEAIGADLHSSHDAVDKMKSLFARIGDNTVRRLQLCLPNFIFFAELCNPISRVGGHSLKVFRLSVCFEVKIHAEQNVFIHTLFSNCLNITELDLLGCYFEKDICEPLSQLKHLTKVQLSKCAISSKYSNEDEEVQISKANLGTFVENCKNITHLDVRRCCFDNRKHFSCRLTDDDLLALATLRNLESLTLWYIRGIREWTFLKHISEHCKFLTTIRICSDNRHFNPCHIPILMESCRLLKHLVIHVDVPFLGLEVFWNLLSHAKKLERLCITSLHKGSLNVPLAVETLKSLPRLHVLHLHDCNIDVKDDFYRQLIRMLEEKEYDCSFSFEIVTGWRRNTWINHPIGCSSISDKLLPLNNAELCNMKPILDIPRFWNSRHSAPQCVGVNS